MKLFVFYTGILIYGLYGLKASFNDRVMDENLLIAVNLSVILCLMLARLNINKAVRGSKIEVEIEKEDEHLAEMERKAYSAAIYIQVAFSLATIATLVGFILLRESQPKIVLVSFLLMAVSFFSLFPNENIIKITNPTFKMPHPKSKNYQQQYFDQFDDGEKYVMLKGLYKIYSLITWGLIILAFILMYYSVFSGNSQIMSIIGIGLLFMLVQVSFTQSLKPHKAD
ncbi:DUF3169 family protein [Ureibacillus sinduriensis]|uniref:DUF3169 domain-containing protein n=1 Tax=Ureibacillus sinduriensis BLB-1 = JCM 15800 TaxID=1384057 RepID=A0A0A3ILU1_9BACL|nr:DUF3169 family protein [Ureibacillus sinduriensis]KGR75782.1 hypothetical protein CD33_09780 [Ureibacillus sinduriensis BLB-1 = JCM 15800]